MAGNYEVISLNTFSPVEPWKKYEYMKGLVVPVKCVKYTHVAGKMHMHFLWKAPLESSLKDLLNESSRVRDDLLKEMPLYYTRAVRREFLHSFGTVTNTKSGILREAYRRLTGDSSAAHDSDEKEVDRCIGVLLDLQVTYWWY